MSIARRSVVVSTTAAGLVLAGAPLAAAFWNGTQQVPQRIMSGAFTVPADSTVSAAAGTTTVAVSWRASTFSGARPVGYSVFRYPSSATAPTGPAPLACSVPAGAVALGTSRSCTDTGGTPGTSYRYAVQPSISSWASATQGLSAQVTFPASTAPAASISVRSEHYKNNQEWTNNGCASSTVCGTVTAGSGTLQSFSVELKRVAEGSTSYWTGSAWSASATNIITDPPAGSSWNFALTYAQLNSGVVSSSTTSSFTVTVSASNSTGQTMTPVAGTFTVK